MSYKFADRLKIFRLKSFLAQKFFAEILAQKINFLFEEKNQIFCLKKKNQKNSNAF